MFPWSLHYRFVQPFSVPAKAAFEWCTAYHPDDLRLMGTPGTRRIAKVADDVLVLTDTYENARGSPLVKRKLVRLDEDKLWWSATYISGPNKYSQFLYRVIPKGQGRSELEFDGLQVNYYPKRATKREVAVLEDKLKREDSGSWRRLAAAMETELGTGGGRERPKAHPVRNPGL